MSGDESQEYIDNPENTSVVTLGAVLLKDDSILHLLDTPVGSAYKRNFETSKFETL